MQLVLGVRVACVHIVAVCPSMAVRRRILEARHPFRRDLLEVRVLHPAVLLRGGVGGRTHVPIRLQDGLRHVLAHVAALAVAGGRHRRRPMRRPHPPDAERRGLALVVVRSARPVRHALLPAGPQQQLRRVPHNVVLGTVELEVADALGVPLRDNVNLPRRHVDVEDAERKLLQAVLWYVQHDADLVVRAPHPLRFHLGHCAHGLEDVDEVGVDGQLLRVDDDVAEVARHAAEIGFDQRYAAFIRTRKTHGTVRAERALGVRAVGLQEELRERRRDVHRLAWGQHWRGVVSGGLHDLLPQEREVGIE
eukprot:PhM_4_TR12665/c0_g1_i1/m.74509